MWGWMYGLESRLGLISDYSNYFSIISFDCLFHDLNCVDCFTVCNSPLIFYYTCACVILITEYLPYLANSCFPYIVVGHIIFVFRGFELSTLVVRRSPVGTQQQAGNMLAGISCHETESGSGEQNKGRNDCCGCYGSCSRRRELVLFLAGMVHGTPASKCWERIVDFFLFLLKQF